MKPEEMTRDQLLADNLRLRERVHEVQRNNDQRNRELHTRVAYYESIRDKTNSMLDRFLEKRPMPMSTAVSYHWFGDLDHTMPFVAEGHFHPGSLAGFWMAFRLMVEEDLAHQAAEAKAGDDPPGHQQLGAGVDDGTHGSSLPG